MRFAILLATVAAATIAHADPALPDAMRAKLEKLAPIQSPAIYVPPAAKVPARWLVFVGIGAAMSAWVVTPGDPAHELSRVDHWPLAVRVIGATSGTIPKEMPGNAGEAQAFLDVETLESTELGQPAGVRSILVVGMPEPQYVSGVATYRENLPAFAGVKSATENAARLATAASFWGEDTPDKILVDDERRKTILDAAKKSDAALEKLVPATGIPILDTWQASFARETGRVRKLDDSAATKQLRVALAAAEPCDWHACGDILVGTENGRVVIRAVLVPKVAARTRGLRHSVAANPKDTQTSETARALGVAGVFRIEAPLGATGTIGVVGNTLIERDGPFARASDISGSADGAPRLADFNGDGITDLLFVAGRHPTFVFGGLGNDNSDVAAALAMASLGKKTIDDIATAALALPDDPVTPAEACALIDGAKTSKALEKVLAPHAEIFAFEEPGDPAAGRREAFKGKERVSALHGRTCELSCDASLPACVQYGQGPDNDYFLFTRIKGKLKLLRAALYRGG